MLDLQAGVHFEEVKFAVFVQEFHGADAAIVHLARAIRAEIADEIALFLRQDGRAAFLDDFLVAALDGAVALAEVNHVALAVAQYLHLDMAWIGEVFFHVHVAVAKSRFCFGRGHGVAGLEFVFVARDFHALAAAACHRLDKDGEADFFGKREAFVRVLQDAGRAGDEGQAEFPHGVFRHRLVAHAGDVFGRGADEGEVVFLHHARKFLVLGQETDAGVDGVDAGQRCRRQDRRDVEIALARRGRADAYAFIRHAHSHAVCVCRRMHDNRADAHFLAGPHDTQCNLAAVRDQDFVEHGFTR